MTSQLGKSERTSLCDALHQRHFVADDVIVRQGDLGASMFFIEDGQVTITAAKDVSSRGSRSLIH